jgi:T5orf172 domain
VIYFAALPGGSIKIGTTENIETRLYSLTSHYGTELALLATMPGDRSVEAKIHERFSHLRLGRTEQFRPAADLMAFIGKPLLVGINPDVVEAMAAEKPARKYGSLIRVSAEFAEALADAARIEKMSAGEFADAHLLAVVRKRYREVLVKEAKRVEGGGK